MAKTLTNAQTGSLLLILGVLTEVGCNETQPVKRAAIAHCATTLLEIIAPARTPAASVAAAAPPQTPVTAITPAAPPLQSTQARRSAGAVKANATRKAKKALSADTATTGDASGKSTTQDESDETPD